ncbi:MAG: NAD(P)/FAD-dependent oxidoreductase [Turicibacter sp.]|nr:NAD(P)/FAD-dependent oxidoreductase [Turicibacter sp.]
MDKYSIIIVGGGPAGLAAAYGAWKSEKFRESDKILIIERDKELGGILNQCIHNGFGLHYFKEELTGPEYAERFVRMLEDSPIEIMTDTMVLEITRESEGIKVCTIGKNVGYTNLYADTIVLSMGCRERTRGAIGISGTRPAGVFTAGTAQRYVNIEGYMPGRRVVVLGSGDIGLIMARRMTLEGAKVLACVELMPFSSGLTRNIVQCLHDYDIPLYLSHTITEIRGEKRVEQVVMSRVDENRRPIAGSEVVFDCDTLLLSVGLIPENELSKTANIELDMRTGGPVVSESMETSSSGIFACGNVLHVHDLVDFVSQEGERAGISAISYVHEISQGREKSDIFKLINGANVSYTVPQRMDMARISNNTTVFFRVNRVFAQSRISVTSGGVEIVSYKRTHMLPAEMERILLPKKILERANGDITISCTEETR